MIDPERVDRLARGLIYVSGALRDPRALEAHDAIRQRLIYVRDALIELIADSEPTA